MVAHVVFDAASLPASAGLPALAAIALLVSVPVLSCLMLPAVGPACACLLLLLVFLPRLLWQGTSQPAEGRLFDVSNLIYWNVMYPALFGSPLALAAACLLKPRVCLPAAGLYVLYIKVLSRPDLRGGAGWPLFAQRDWGIVAYRHYLRLKLHIPQILQARPADKPVVIAVHPHGMAADYRVAMDGMLYAALPGRQVFTLSASVLFSLPLVRELCLWTRCIDASKPVAARALKRGRSLMVIPGGEAEQMRTQTGVEEVFLSKRVGFVKLAMQHGAALVPCYAFGVVDLYSVTAAQHKTNSSGWLWALSKKAGVAMPRYAGSFGFMPHRRPTDLVFDEPFEPACATPGRPTDAEVAAAHAEYIARLRRLFDDHKDSFGFEDRQLLVT